jgi:hypothetical protein
MVLVDPVEAAARAMIRMADESKLLPRGGESGHELVHFHRITVPTTAKDMFKAALVGTNWKKLADKHKSELENKLKLAHHKEEGAVTAASHARRSWVGLWWHCVSLSFLRVSSGIHIHTYLRENSQTLPRAPPTPCT